MSDSCFLCVHRHAAQALLPPRGACSPAPAPGQGLGTPLLAAWGVPGGWSSWGCLGGDPRGRQPSACWELSLAPLLWAPGQNPRVRSLGPPPSPCRDLGFQPAEGVWGMRTGCRSGCSSAGTPPFIHSFIHSLMSVSSRAASGPWWETTEPGSALVDLPFWRGERLGPTCDKTVSTWHAADQGVTA